VSRARSQPLAASIDRLQKLLYGMRRQKLQRTNLSLAGAGVLVLVIVLTAAH